MNADALSNRVREPRLADIARKAIAGAPVSEDDLRHMLSTNNVLELGAIADFVRRRLHENRAYYGVNMNLNYTNVCELRCPLCAYSKDREDSGAFTLSLEEIEDKVRQGVARGIDEVHIVGGLNPELPFEYYPEMLRRIKRINPDIHIVAFTAVEYDYFARRSGMLLDEVFRTLIDAGLGALPGGGAEIFDENVRSVIAPKKISGERWLEVMRTAHSVGLKTNATMLYNHIESIDDVVDHLTRIRALQNETGGFKTFVPLAFHSENTGIPSRRRDSTGYDDIRIYASSRIFLHNVPHIKALWMYVGEKMAQVLLSFGVDDFGATYVHEKVVHAAGARTPDYGTETHLKRLISEAGFVPLRVNASYGERP